MRKRILITDVSKRIDNLLAKTTLQESIRSQLLNHREMYERSVAYLANNEHKVSFIGNVGAGKTTSICHLLGLVSNGTPILSTGSGRTTLCEVHLKNSLNFCIEVEPYTEQEVSSYLYDFSLYLKSKDEYTEQEGFKLSAEIERAIRNMLDLKVVRKKVEGKRTATDFAKIFANSFEDIDSLHRELVRRIDMNSRTKTTFSNNDDTEPYSWLHETFKLVNSATHKEVGLAKKITLSIPNLIPPCDDFSVTFVDTKGVDQTVNRIDLDECLTNDKTVSILCSRFNDAPDQTCSKMIDSAIQAGLKPRLINELLLLVLDRAGEAEDVMDYDEAVGDKEEGRDIKADQISGELSQRYAVRDLDIEFFDAKLDQPTDVLDLIISKVTTLRTVHKQRLNDICESICDIENELETQSASIAMNQVKFTLEPWLKKSQACSPTLSEFFVPLVNAISSKGTYAASVRASVNRNGDWNRLDYYQELAVAARGQCGSKIFPLRDELITLIDNMMSQVALKPAYSLLKQLKLTTEVRLDEIAQLALAKGRSVYESKLKHDSEFWNKNYSEWGLGSGYKDRVSDNTHKWFKTNDYSRFEFEVTRTLVDQWENYIQEIEKLIGSGLK
ncbi:hypothetical protein ACN5WT_003093 [Vibrio parahaemolyticus]